MAPLQLSVRFEAAGYSSVGSRAMTTLTDSPVRHRRSSASSASSTSSSATPAEVHRPRDVPRRPVRPGPGLGPLPRGRRRSRPRPEAAADRQRADLRRRRARTRSPQPDRLRHVRPDRRRVGHRGAEAALPAAAVHRRGDLVPALQRAGRGLRLRRPVVPRREGRRRVDRQRPEGVDDARPHRQVGPARRAHRPRRAQARGLTSFVVDMQAPGRRGPAAAPDDRRGRVQRGVLHRRPHPRQRAPRRSRATAGGSRSRRS